MLSNFQIAIVTGLAAMVSWGLADFFVKKTVDKIDEVKTQFWSQIFGLIPMIIYLVLDFELPPFNFGLLSFLLVLSVFDTFGILLFFRGLRKGKASVISPIYSSYAAVAVIISFVIFGELIAGFAWIGIGVIFLGIILASFNYKEIREMDFELKDLSKGVPETLLAALIIGIFFPLWDSLFVGQGWVVFIILNSVVMTLTLLVKSLIGKTSLAVEDKSCWKWLFLIGIFSWGAWLSVIIGFKLTKFTSVISVLSAASPIIVVVLARTFLKERMSLTQKLGVVFLLAGLFIISV